MHGINWSSYEYPSWEISLEYPDAWSVSSLSAQSNGFLLIAAGQDDGGCQPHISLRCIRSHSGELPNLDDFVDDTVPSLMGSEDAFEFIERGDFVNRDTVRCLYLEYYSRVDTVHIHTRTSFVPLKDSLFLLSATSSAAVWKRYTEIFEHVILSVKGIHGSKELSI